MDHKSGVLVGRAAECARTEGLLNAAHGGRSEVLIVRGEPGVGKSALLRYALERATQAGLTTISARGIESESEIPFAGLADLIRPVRQAISSIPETQQAVLAGALALGPPIPGDRFAVCAATLSLLAAAAEQKPLLCVVDDIQWLDASSAEAVVFAARRVEAEGIGVLIALREGERATIDLSDFPTLRLDGLNEQAAIDLLTATQPGLTAEVALQLNAAVRGNPLALLEIPALLSEAEQSGAAPLPDPLPVGPNLERAFLRRVRGLPRDAQRALVAAAASESGDLTPILRAMELMRLPAGALDAAESSGLVSIEGAQLRFRHPLLRSAVYEAAGPVDRRSAHGALATALDDERFADRRAWHLAAAATAPDEAVAGALELTAERSKSRRGYGAAAQALVRAASLSPSPVNRARRLLDAAKALQLAGKSVEALGVLDAAMSNLPDDAARSEIELLRAEIEMWVAAPMTAHRRLVAEAARLETSDPSAAAVVLAEAVVACTMAAEISLALKTARRAHVLASQADAPAPLLVDIALASALVLSGHADEASALIEELLGHLAASGPADKRGIHYLIHLLMTCERIDQARLILLRFISEARHAGAVGALPYELALLSELEFRCGDLPAAYAAGTESVRLAHETAQGSSAGYSLVALARVEAAQGRQHDCRRHAAAAVAVAREHGNGSVFHYANAALGLLELGLGSLTEATSRFETVVRLAHENGVREPNQGQWQPDHIEVLTRIGRRDEANRALSAFEVDTARTNRLWARATLARCRGYLAENGYENHFEDALELHLSSPSASAFEIARTRLCYGEVLRRKRDRIQAREQLRAALQTFEELGAEPWAARARAELSATGESARKRKVPSSRDLTPQELQIALAVAGGATNREAASRLFLSPKTVEAHLSSLYRKLEIRSRTDLARLFAGRLAAAVLASIAGLAAHQQLLQDALLLGAWSSPAT
jgi:DNA-binding CsgD family transcriptional regulator/predicted ATPase